MTIASLWYYTQAADPGRLARENERRAFTVYSSWRSFSHRVGAAGERLQAARDLRATRRALVELPDHLLRDIGVIRTRNEFRLANDPVPPRSTASRQRGAQPMVGEPRVPGSVDCQRSTSARYPQLDFGQSGCEAFVQTLSESMPTRSREAAYSGSQQAQSRTNRSIPCSI